MAFTRRLVNRTPSATLGAIVSGFEAFDTGPVLEKVEVPVLVCTGDKDVITPSWLSREMAERLPSAELVVLPGTGHMGMLERHDEVTDRLRSFLERTLL